MTEAQIIENLEAILARLEIIEQRLEARSAKN